MNSFTVGNHEIANLLVQDQVTKHEARKTHLQNLCDAVTKKTEELKKQLSNIIADQALSIYEEKYRSANKLLVELDLETDISDCIMNCESNFDLLLKPWNKEKWTITKYEDQLTGYRWAAISTVSQFLKKITKTNKK